MILTPEQADGFRRWSALALAHADSVRRKEAAVTYLRILGRGWLIVTLVSANTVHLASGHITYAALGGFAISALWWSNSSKDREHAKGAALVYGLGAALGTLTGATIARLITW